ncbi:MAG: hypothetical protein R6V50_06865 [Thermoplasmatota archaeon]
MTSIHSVVHAKLIQNQTQEQYDHDTILIEKMNFLYVRHPILFRIIVPFLFFRGSIAFFILGNSMKAERKYHNDPFFDITITRPLLFLFGLVMLLRFIIRAGFWMTLSQIFGWRWEEAVLN